MEIRKIQEKFFYKKRKVNKYTEKNILKYSIGTNLYMNGFKDFYKKIVSGEFKDLSSISICFEDSTRIEDLNLCEANVREMLRKLVFWKKENKHMPLLFIRVRNLEQFKVFTSDLEKESLRLIAGFIFPKFNSENGQAYFEILKELNNRENEIFYGMPIIEDKRVLYKETRIDELIKLKRIIDRYKEYTLNIRVGGTDFSSNFGLRRSVETPIYKVSVINDCLIDIVNIFLRDEYVISAPVWEYFSKNINSKEMKGFIEEIKLDKENGFIGKTIIHPLQIKVVNAIYAVTFEEYMDAKGILKEKSGVFKGYGDNKMNEVKPHMEWAKKVLKRAEAFGVLNEEIIFEDLL